MAWLSPIPSVANFILCRVLRGKAIELHQKLRDKGVLVRYFDQPLLKDYIRVSVGTPAHTDTLVRTLREIGG